MEKEESRWTVAASIDVTALYPSLDIREAAKICGEAFAKSTLKCENINYRTATVFLAVTLTDEEKRE